MNETNKQLREIFNYTIEENGLLLAFASKKMGIVSPTLSRWRYGHFDFGAVKLGIIKEFCSRYEN